MNAELKSWLCDTLEERERKAEREFARYPKLIKEMGLDLIRTDNKVVLDIGCGPRGIWYHLPARYKYAIDPLIEKYDEYYNLDFIDGLIKGKGENMSVIEDDSIDLVTTVNSLDHCKSPEQVLREVKRVLAPSGYLAVHFCINLATNHPHPSHQLNISPEVFHDLIDKDFETVHELTFDKDNLRYGWVKYKNKCGLPALAGLYRLTTKGG